MKLCAARSLYAMNWPDTSISGEVFGLGWMPIASLENRLTPIQKLFDEFVQRRHHFVSMSHRQRSARAEIVLHVDHDQSFLLTICHR